MHPQVQKLTHTLHILFPTYLEISMNNMLLMAILHCRYYLDRKQAKLCKWHLKEAGALIKDFNIYYWSSHEVTQSYIINSYSDQCIWEKAAEQLQCYLIYLLSPILERGFCFSCGANYRPVEAMTFRKVTEVFPFQHCIQL